MGIRLNPFTGELDLVGTTGGGAGTVTSVAGGVGITNVPEPIVGAGTVNLDIDSLTTETTLAAGDLFPFVDVSAGGTAITNQRKVTFADLVTSIGAASGGDPFDQYLLLAGRTGTTNDAVISTTTDGTITGSATAGASLGLNATTSSTLAGFGIKLHPNVDTVTQGVVMSFVNALTLDATASAAFTALMIVDNSTVWTVEGANGFFSTALDFQPTIQNDDGVAMSIFSFGAAIQWEPAVRARNAACTAGDLDTGLIALSGGPTFTTSGTGTLDVTATGLCKWAPEGDAGATIQSNIGYEHNAVLNVGSVIEDIAFVIDDQGAGSVLGSATHASILSNGSTRRLGHAGPAVFGSSSAPATSVGLELRSNVLAFLPSRMSTAEKNALTAVNGMILYDNDQTKINARENGAWVTFQPLDDDLTALSALATTGIAVRTGAGTWTTRSLVQPAAGITIANADGVAGNPTFSLANDLAALEGLAGTGIAVRSAADTWVQRSIAVTDSASVDFTITDGNGVAGNPTITASVIAAGVDHGGLGGLGDDDHTQYLLLAGRAGSANDPILSTTTGGLISGSSASGQAIDIQSTTHATKGVINLRDETRLRTSFTGASSGQNYMERLAQDMSNGDIGNITVLGVTGTWTQTADAVATHRLFNPGNATDNFIIQNASGVVTLPSFECLSSGVRFRSNTADNVTAANYFCISDSVQVLDTSTGTSTLTNLVTVRSNPTVSSGNTITNRWGMLLVNRASAGTQTNFFGVDIESQTVGTLAVSLRSQGTNAEMRHAGPARFGANSQPTNPTKTAMHIDGGLVARRTTFSNAAYTIDAAAGFGDLILAQVGTMSASRTVTLPAAATAGAGRVIVVKDESNTVTGANDIVVDGNGGETIDGFATQHIDSGLGSITIYCNGSNWFMIATQGTITGV